MKKIPILAIGALLAAQLSAPLSAQTITAVELGTGQGGESLAVDQNNNCYLSHTATGTILKVTPGGAVSTFATIPGGTTVRIFGLKFDCAGNLCVCARGTSAGVGIYKVPPDGTPFAFSVNPAFTSINDMCFDPRGNLYVSDPSSPTNAKIWKIDQAGRPQSGRPTRQRIVSGSWDGTAKVWDAVSGRELLTLKGHSGWVLGVAFSPDGQRIVTASQDHTAKVWEAATAKQVAAWKAEEDTAQRRLALWRAAAAETRAREIAALAGPPESAPKHEPSTRKRALMPGYPGAIRQWLVLAPLPFEGDADLNVLKQQISNEARLRPRQGERPASAPAALAWSAVRLGEDSYQLDFKELVNKAKPEADTDYQVAYAVAYIVSESPQTGLMLLVGSDDTARIYLNEKEIYRQLNPTTWETDRNEVSGVNLKAGLNVLVFKVANATGDWSGSVRLLAAAGQPVKGIKVTLDPKGKE